MIIQIIMIIIIITIIIINYDGSSLLLKKSLA